MEERLRLAKKERKELLEMIEKDLSALKELYEAIQMIIEKLESQAKRLRYQQTLPTED